MRTPFVGRERELAVLEECLASALAGQPGVVLCQGEPGVGKTRLVEELSSAADSTGVVVVWGRAPEAAGAPPYWPWRQILRAAGDHADLARLARDYRLTAELAHLAPDVFPGEPEKADGPGTAEDRFRLFDAVDRLLRLLSHDRPLLIVLDDAHWADDSSLLLLQHLAESMAAQRLLLVVNQRDTEPVSDVLLTRLGRIPAARVMEIGGLSPVEVGVQLASVVSGPLSERDVQQVHARTGGNPFYVAELGRALVDRANPLTEWPVPTSVREAIRARLIRLTPGTVRLLQNASVIGREFPLTVVAEMLQASELECLPLLEEATAAGLVAASPDETRFVHDLVRDAVEAGLTAADRVTLHRRAADAVERLHSGRLDAHLSDLARHWAAAAVSGERGRAAEWITRAADEAMRRLAYEEAARFYRLALTVGAGDIDADRRCRLLLAAAGALKGAGELSARLPICREAAALARGLRRPDLLAEASLAMESGESTLEAELSVRAISEEALAALPPSASALRARVSANLSTACMYLGDLEAAERASTHALAMAYRSADPTSLAAALRARQLVVSGPEGIEERASLANRMDALGRAARDPALRMWGHLWRVDVAFERGDLPAVSRELEPLAQSVAEVRTPVARWHLLQARAVFAQAVGRFGDARLLVDRAVAVLGPSSAGGESAQINRAALLSMIGLHTGDAPDLTGLDTRPGHDDDALDFPLEGVIFAIAAAFFLAHTGSPAQAATLYRRLGRPASWRPIPHTTTTCFAFGIGTAIALDAPDDVAVLYERLARFRGRHVADGAGAVAYNGPVELYLGSAEAHLGLLDDAVDDLEAASSACAANGAAGFGVQSRFELATVLSRRARPGDLVRARTLGVQVMEQASALRMAPWSEGARRLVARLDDERGNPLTPREREVAVLVGEGLTNRQIAERLYLSERTAQNHVQHILTKLDLPNRGQIAVWVATRN